MTKTLPQIDNVCLQCNGYHCPMAKDNCYKYCDRWKMLSTLQDAGYDILEFDSKMIFQLARKVIEDFESGKHKPATKTVSKALAIVKQWEAYQ